MDTRLVDVLHDFKIWNPGRHLRCVLFISLSDHSFNSIRTRVIRLDIFNKLLTPRVFTVIRVGYHFSDHNVGGLFHSLI